MREKMDHIQKVITQYDSSFFYYDLDAFEAHIKSIKATLHPDVKIWYACKANPLSKILSIFNEQGFGVDVASLGELKQAQTAGVKNLISTGPAKSKKYLKKMMDEKVSTIIIESPNQLKDMNAVAAEAGRSQDVLLRVQLEWSGELKSVLGGSSITPFGIGVEDWKKISLQEYTHLNIKGLHCFQWGNILDIKQLANIWEMTIKQCVDLAQFLKIDLKVLDLGGGLGVSYKDETHLPFSDVHELLLGFKQQFKLQEIWLELGRFSVANFGSYLTRIIDIKTVRGKELIVTEGGINHIARPALVGEAFPCAALESSNAQAQKYSVHGPLCTALDFLGEFDFPSDLKPGDWLIFHKAGAYGFTESLPYFLCHSMAGEAYSYQNEIHFSRPPVLPQDWL